MAKVVFICRDALENSIIGNIGMAMEAKKAGDEASVIFTQESLAALSGLAFDWSPLFRPREMRIKISKSAEEKGIPAAYTKDSRWTDMKRLIKGAKEAGVELLACPLWNELLGTKGNLPTEIAEIDMAGALAKIKEAQTVIGSF